MGFSGSPNSPEINVTPLIDVLLVLIIVFMVVVSMSKQKGLDAQIPQPAQDASQVPPPERTVVIQLEENGDGDPNVKINNQPVSWQHLQEKLNDIFAIRVEKVAFVEADEEVFFNSIAQVIDAAHAAGVAHVGLLTSRGKQVAQAAPHSR